MFIDRVRYSVRGSGGVEDGFAALDFFSIAYCPAHMFFNALSF